MMRTSFLATLAFALWQTAALGADEPSSTPRKRRAKRPRCAAPSKVTPAFGPDGTLWLAWMAGGQISVASSRDGGASFSRPFR